MYKTTQQRLRSVEEGLAFESCEGPEKTCEGREIPINILRYERVLGNHEYMKSF